MVSDSRQHAVSLLRQLDEAPQLALVDLGLPPAPTARRGISVDQRPPAHSPAMKILVLSDRRRRQRAARTHTGRGGVRRQACDPENLKKILLHALQFRAAEISGEGLPRAILWSGRARRCKN